MADEDEFSAIVDANIDRVDLVGKAANGTQFLIAKSAVADADIPAGLMPPRYVEALAKGTDVETIAKDDPAENLDAGEMQVAPAQPSAEATVPSSGAWEQIDADTAQHWTAILSRAKAAISLMSDRENTEGMLGDDPGDASNAWDLQDACMAVDYAISVLAPFAVSEQMEADEVTDAMTMVKSVAAPLGTDGFAKAVETAEALAPIVKAGRVLSGTNEAALRKAADLIQQVLSSLPDAPEAEVTKGADMADETTTTEVAKAEPEAPATTAPDTAPVAKADGDPADVGAASKMVPMYNAAGKLIGVVDPSDIVSLADDGSADAAPAADDGVVAAPAATVAKSDEDVKPEQGSVDPLVKAELDRRDEEIAALREQITAIAKATPAASRVLLNGQVQPHMARTQGSQAEPTAVGEAAEIRKAWTEAGDTPQRDRMTATMQDQAMAAIRALQGKPGAPVAE